MGTLPTAVLTFVQQECQLVDSIRGVLEENIGGAGQDKKLTGQNYQINHFSPPKKRSPLYNCLLVLLLHSAYVAKDLEGKAKVWGQLHMHPPLPQHITAPGSYRRVGPGVRK